MPPLPKINSLHAAFIAARHSRGVWWPQASWTRYSIGIPQWAHVFPGLELFWENGSFFPSGTRHCSQPEPQFPAQVPFHTASDALRPPMSWQLEFDEIILIHIFLKARWNIGTIQLCPKKAEPAKLGWVFYSLVAQSKHCLRYPKDWDHATLPSNGFPLSMVSSASVARMFTAIPQPHRMIGTTCLARETDPKAEASPRQRVRP